MRHGAIAMALAALLCGCQGGDHTAAPDPATSPSASARPGQADGQRQAEAQRVEVAVMRPSAADLALSLPGEVEASRDANLAAALGGYVERVNVEAGDEVRKGQVLAMIDSKTHSARLAQAKVELDTAKTELKRVEKLKGAVPAARLDAAQARVDAAKAAYRSAAVMVERSVITSPFAGVVARCDAEVGEVAPPGAPLIRVVQLDPIKVSVSLSDRDVGSVKEGMEASVTADARASVIKGKVSHIRPAADTNTRSFIAEVSIDNGTRELLPGMIATVSLTAQLSEKQIVVSQDWLVTKPKELGAFVNVDGVARWRTVKAGAVVRDRVVVLEGIKEGDELIIAGHRELADGDRLIVARKGTCCREGRVYFDDQVAR